MPVRDGYATPKLALADTTRAEGVSGDAPAAIPGWTRIGRFVILRTLGQGGMGVVYAGYDNELERKVAIKLLRARSQDERARARMLREAQSLARISHPNVIQVYEVGSFAGQVYIVMEYVDGPTVHEWLSRDSPDWRQILDVFLDAGRGLATAHRAGIVHRDLKPANMILGDDGRVRVLDFGLARFAEIPDPEPADDTDTLDLAARLDRASRIHTQTGTILGTPVFMSPEQHRGEEAGPASDQFSFCVALYQGLFSSLPFRGRDLGQLRESVLSGDREPVPSDTRVPRRIVRVLEKGLSLAPDERFPDMDTLLLELERDPLVRLQRGGMVLVLLALFIGLSIWLARGTAPVSPGPVCDRAAERADAVWNQDSVARVAQGFSRSGRAHAQESFSRLRSNLDTYLDRWRDMRIDACEATHVRGEQSEAALDARMRCLDQRLGSVGALIELLGEAERGEVVDGALDAAYDLPALDECADVERLLARAPLPSEPVAREFVAQLSQRLQRVRALESVGDYINARALMDELWPQAQGVSYMPLAAEVKHLSGVLYERMGDFQAAERDLLAAALLAARAHHDTLSIAIWTELVRVVGHDQGKFDEALWIGQMAEFAIERVGGLELARADLLAHLGSSAFAAERFTEAETYHSEALTIRRDQLGPRHPAVGESLNHLGAVLHNQGKTAEAAKKDLEAHTIQLEALGAHHPRVADSYNNLGVTLMAEQRYAEAHEHYMRALETFINTHGATSHRVAIVEHNLGELSRLQGDQERARSHYERALSIFEKTHGSDHPFIAHPLTGLGQALLALERTDQAMDVLSHALAIREKSGADPFTVAHTRFYLQRARWQSGLRESSIRAQARVAYDSYMGDPAHLPGEAALMKAWLDSLPP